MSMILGKLREFVMDREAWRAAIHGVTKSRTWLSNWTLQKAQLEQHKVFQDFPSNPAPVSPSAPPLLEGTYPKVSPWTEPNDSDNDSLETPVSIKTDNTFLNTNTLPALWQRLSELLALQSEVSEASGFSAFPVLRNVDA